MVGVSLIPSFGSGSNRASLATVICSGVDVIQSKSLRIRVRTFPGTISKRKCFLLEWAVELRPGLLLGILLKDGRKFSENEVLLEES